MVLTLDRRPSALCSLVALTTVFLAACGGSGSTAATGSGGDDGGATSTSASTGGGGGGAGGMTSASPSAKPACENGNPVTGGSPDPRADTAGTLSADGRSFVLFGGDTALPVCGQTPKRAHVGDTWLLDTTCGGWTEVSAMGGPSARARHAMALDANRSRALLFGGRTRVGSSGPYTLFNDLWAFDFTTKAWTEVPTTGTGPSARANSAMAVAGDKLLVFGGSTDTSGLTFTPTNDTYSLDLTIGAWTKLATIGGPPPARLFHSFAVDPSGAFAYVYSGGDKNAFTGPFLTDLWTLEIGKAAWSKSTPSKGDTDGAGRIKFGLSARAGEAGKAPVLFAFGGHDDGALGNRNDVITTDTSAASPAWSSVRVGDVLAKMPSGACNFPVDFTTQDPASPERRSAFAFGASPSGASFVVVGGDSDCGRMSDAWWFDSVAGAWTAIRTTLPGITCLRTGSTSCTSLCN
jgi:hypothetical protein